MRRSSFIATVVVVSIIGLLGFRIVDLEQRVTRMSEQLGAAERSSTPTSAPSSGNGASTDGLEKRLTALEKRLGNLESRPHEQANADRSLVAREKDILSVVERENSRIRDVQLEWRRGRWLEGRDNQLAQFAAHQQLSPSQSEALHRALESETDAMIAVLKKPGLAEDPDQATADWLKLLRDTDERASSILTPEQQRAWQFARFVERRLLWPWLPEPATASR